MDINTASRYIFWLDDPLILFRDGNYLNFIPTKNMTIVEQMNALTTFFLYYAIILLMFGTVNGWMYVPIIGVTFIIVVYYIYYNDDVGKRKELFKRKFPGYVDKLENFKQNNKTVVNDTEYELQSGFYDSEGNLLLGQEYNEKTNKNSGEINYGVNEMLEYQKATCNKSNRNNPFKNPPITDFNNGDRPVACNDDDEKMDNIMINENFNADLYRDIQDLYDTKNSIRQFYTVPVTSIPADQTSFAHWLYGENDTCKVNQTKCLRYEDLRLVSRVN